MKSISCLPRLAVEHARTSFRSAGRTKGGCLASSSSPFRPRDRADECTRVGQISVLEAQLHMERRRRLRARGWSRWHVTAPPSATWLANEKYKRVQRAGQQIAGDGPASSCDEVLIFGSDTGRDAHAIDRVRAWSVPGSSAPRRSSAGDALGKCVRNHQTGWPAQRTAAMAGCLSEFVVAVRRR
jgi:hypothetical protein